MLLLMVVDPFDLCHVFFLFLFWNNAIPICRRRRRRRRRESYRTDAADGLMLKRGL